MTLSLSKTLDGVKESRKNDVVTSITVEMSALLLALVRYWSESEKGAKPQTVDISEATNPPPIVNSIVKMLQGLQSALRWALEVSELEDHPFTSELLASMLYILNCSPKSMTKFD